MNVALRDAVVAIYVAVVVFLGWLGYRNTRSAADFLVGGRQITRPHGARLRLDVHLHVGHR